MLWPLLPRSLFSLALKLCPPCRLPPKSFGGNKKPDFIEQRRRGLQRYLTFIGRHPGGAACARFLCCVHGIGLTWLPRCFWQCCARMRR